MTLQSRNINSEFNSVHIAVLIFSEYGDFIYAVIRSKVKNDSLADDLFQDFFLSLISRPPLDKVQNMKSYLYRAITNDFIDAMHRVEVYQSYVNRYAKNSIYSVANGNPQKVLIKIEETNKMFELIERLLKHSEARAISLRYRNNHDTKEIADIMNVDKRSVSRYISVGLKKLREFFTITDD